MCRLLCYVLVVKLHWLNEIMDAEENKKCFKVYEIYLQVKVTLRAIHRVYGSPCTSAMVHVSYSFPV